MLKGGKGERRDRGMDGRTKFKLKFGQAEGAELEVQV